jgi:hypothetical protein
MSFTRVSSGLKFLCGLCVLLLFVALLTLIFSFLGTIFCAALCGLMMGCSRVSKLLALPSSALFPGVLLAVLASQHSEMTDHQRVVLSGVTLATFWIIYLVGATMMAFEKKNPQPDPGPKIVQEAAGAPPASAAPGPATGLAEAGELFSPSACQAMSLEELEGSWHCETCGADGRAQQKLLEIKGATLVLRKWNAEGRVCSCAQCRLRLTDLSGAATLLVSDEAGPALSPSFNI